MIVSLKADANPAEVLRALVSRGLWVSQVERSASGEPRHYVIASYSAATSVADLAAIEGVSSVTTAKPDHPRVAAQGPIVDVAGVSVGGGKPVFMVGPCSVESEGHVREIAERLAPLGVAFLRGGAYKPRTSPYAFQGHGEIAPGWLKRAAEATGMKVVTEALSEADVPAVADLADLVQVGSRNMQNYALLKAVGRTGRPVLLKRGMSATMDEWLHSGEYLLAGGSRGVIFCERGIRSFDDATRNLLDLGAVAKGMAMDLAARELEAFPNYLIEAGGDVCVRGHNARGEAWQIGIQHPREPDAMFATLAITDAAVCTSGDYERPAPEGNEVREVSKGEHHLLDPHAGRSPRTIISATVIAPTAMAADALSTAAFVLGPEAGIAFLERQGVAGLLVTPALKPYTTEGFARYFL